MTSRLWLALLAILALASGCSTLVPAPSAPGVGTAQAQAAWARVLEEFVNDSGEVDFAVLATRRADLDVFVRHLADTLLDSLPDGPQRLAHMIATRD